MDEFTPETLAKYINSKRTNRNVDDILSRIDQQQEKNLKNTIPTNIAKLDAQVRNSLAEIIRECLKHNNKELLKKILSEHKSFIETILNTLI